MVALTKGYLSSLDFAVKVHLTKKVENHGSKTSLSESKSHVVKWLANSTNTYRELLLLPGSFIQFNV